MENFEEIEIVFSKLLKATMSTLVDYERAEVQSFIDVGEYGLALLTLVDIYVEEKKMAPPDVIAFIKALAEAMSIEADSLLQRMPTSE